MYELSDQFGIDRKTVSRTRRRHHIPMRRTSLRPDQINHAARLYQNGWSTAHIAEHMNTDQRTVQRRLGEQGIKMRGTHGNHELERKNIRSWPMSALMVMRLFTRQASSLQSRALWEHIRLARRRARSTSVSTRSWDCTAWCSIRVTASRGSR